jgi:UDP-glucose 4-epimerase
VQRILVTGASGYIGQHLVASLVHNNVTVRGFARSAKPANLSDIEWHQGDVSHLADVQQAATDCTAIVHLACRPLGPSFQEPISDFQVNALGTLNVLQAARLTEVRRVIYISTAQIYGFTEHLPMREDDLPQPASPYAASKLCGEHLCTTFAHCYGLDTVILRLFNVYGLSMDGNERNTVEALFLRRIIQGLPPIIKGDPTQGRDFIHISDVVWAIQLALTTTGSGTVINIGTGIMTTLWELAELAAKIVGVSLNPVVEDTDITPFRLQADTGKARAVLNFNATTSLSTGLASMIK